METRESFKQIESGLCWHSCLQNICLEEKKICYTILLAKIIQSTFFIIWYVMKQNVFWEKYVISSRLGLNQLSFNSAILLPQVQIL